MKLIANLAWLATCIAGTAVVADLGGQASAQDASAGGRVFTRCQACHQVDRARGSGLGPNMAGIVGRKAGSVPRFNYSPAMVRSNIVWDKAKMDAFLAAPQRVVPGNRMSFPGLANAKDRADVIAYLATRK